MNEYLGEKQIVVLSKNYHTLQKVAPIKSFARMSMTSVDRFKRNSAFSARTDV
jgi:hypothetical protein